MDFNDLKDFITPADHLLFRAKKLFGREGKIIDAAIAYLEPAAEAPLKCILIGTTICLS